MILSPAYMEAIAPFIVQRRQQKRQSGCCRHTVGPSPTPGLDDGADNRHENRAAQPASRKGKARRHGPFALKPVVYHSAYCQKADSIGKQPFEERNQVKMPQLAGPGIAEIGQGNSERGGNQQLAHPTFRIRRP